MSEGIEVAEAASDQERSTGQDWAAHRNALQMPELRSALEQLHAHLEAFLKDGQRS